MTSPTGPGPTLLRLGQTATVLKTAEGGAIGAEVSPEGLDPSRKQLGPVNYEDLLLTLPAPPASKMLRDWMTEAFTDRRTPASGDVVGTIPGLTTTSVRTFTDALIASIAFPELDVRDTTPADLVVTLRPATLSVATTTAPITAPPAQPRWRTSDFTLNIAGLDPTAVIRIESFTVEMPIDQAQDRYGTSIPRPVPGRPALPTFQLQIAATRADPWIKWHNDFVINANHTPAAERTATLQLLSATRTKVLATLTLEGLGISKLTWPTLGAPTTTTPTLTADLYAERLTLSW